MVLRETQALILPLLIPLYIVPSLIYAFFALWFSIPYLFILYLFIPYLFILFPLLITLPFALMSACLCGMSGIHPFRFLRRALSVHLHVASRTAGI